MSDLLAGSTVEALDTPVTTADTQNDQFTFNSTTFGTDNDSGIYFDCGVAFLAPTTGRVVIHFAAALDNSSDTARTDLAPVVRSGSTIGSGSTIVAATIDNAIQNFGTNEARLGAHLFVDGLTPGATYNVRLEHRVSSGNGTIRRRAVTVTPST